MANLFWPLLVRHLSLRQTLNATTKRYGLRTIFGFRSTRLSNAFGLGEMRAQIPGNRCGRQTGDLIILVESEIGNGVHAEQLPQRSVAEPRHESEKQGAETRQCYVGPSDLVGCSFSM